MTMDINPFEQFVQLETRLKENMIEQNKPKSITYLKIISRIKRKLVITAVNF